MAGRGWSFPSGSSARPHAADTASDLELCRARGPSGRDRAACFDTNRCAVGRRAPHRPRCGDDGSRAPQSGMAAQDQVDRNRRRAGRAAEPVRAVAWTSRSWIGWQPIPVPSGRGRLSWTSDVGRCGCRTRRSTETTTSVKRAGRQVKQALRTARARGRPQGRQPKPKLKGMINIADRPAEAADRAVPGHWEGDLILGADCRSAIGTWWNGPLGSCCCSTCPTATCRHRRRAMSVAIGRLPEQLWRSLTWDQGSEMALHPRVAEDRPADLLL